ncbi:hypothetical protein [Calothrix sp. PCC 6303]|uniref:hypothetical protein n=1 Tax=Calothrix sp. PCC 6303 TaxID=1170562 RepID=UPI0002A03D82|nr:hypothetical protein [Calothrix sp. PCC 6303]AFZ04558.1 hypothetical protein Cal6303_5686 [Calothrix sp. PCC 6303]
MKSQNWRESEDFFKRFLLQGKIISQLIVFWWRYDRNPKTTENDRKKMEIAKLLSECFFPNYISRPGVPGGPTPDENPPSESLINLFETESKLPASQSLTDQSLPRLSLIDLFKADPRLHINEEKPEISVEALITIFGRDRICNEKTYLSPIFNSTELGLEDGNNLARYEFKIDTSGTKFGKLTDPEIVIEKENSLLKYIYIIPIPIRPPGVDNDIYERWISNENDLYPPNQLIPFTT